MQTATLTAEAIRMPKEMLKKGFVILGLDEYEELKKSTVPNYYLSGKAAEDLDREVEQALQEDREGKTIEAYSVREAMAIYDAKKNNKN